MGATANPRTHHGWVTPRSKGGLSPTAPLPPNGFTVTSLPMGTWMSTRSLSSTLQFSNLLLHPIPRLPVKSWLLFPKPKLVGEERAGLWDGNSSRTSPAEPLLGCLLMQSANLEKKKIIYFFLFSSPYNVSVNVLQDNSHQLFFFVKCSHIFAVTAWKMV